MGQDGLHLLDESRLLLGREGRGRLVGELCRQGHHVGLRQRLVDEQLLGHGLGQLHGLRRHHGSDLVPLRDGVLVSELGGCVEPHVGALEVLRYPETTSVDDAEIELAVRNAKPRGILEPAHGFLEVGLAESAFGIQHTGIVHGAGIALRGSALIPGARRLEVLLDAQSLLVEIGEAVLRGGEILRGGTLEPGQRERLVLLDAHADAIAAGDLVLRLRITRGGGDAQGLGA